MHWFGEIWFITVMGKRTFNLTRITPRKFTPLKDRWFTFYFVKLKKKWMLPTSDPKASNTIWVQGIFTTSINTINILVIKTLTVNNKHSLIVKLTTSILIKYF